MFACCYCCSVLLVDCAVGFDWFVWGYVGLIAGGVSLVGLI